MILELLQNVALLVSLAVGLRMLSRRLEGQAAVFNFVSGLLFGVVGIVGMMTPMQFAPGVIYDGRSIVLSLAGLFGGPVAAVISAAICGVYRMSLGGAGALAGVLVVIESAALGVVLHYLRKRNERWVSPARLWLFGLLVHIIMLALQLLIAGGVGMSALMKVGPSVLLFYPLGFLLIAQVFLEAERRQKAEVILQQSEERYRSLFENNHAVMLIIDPDTGVIVDANPAAGKFYGWSRDELRKKNIFDMNTQPSEDIQREMMQAEKANRRFFVFRHRLANGSVRDVEVHSGPIQLNGRNLLYSVIHDITERKQSEQARLMLEEQLRQAQKMEAVGQLAGGVAHDFNNLLQVIGGHCEVAMVESMSNAPLMDNLQLISKATNRASTLVRQLLAFSRRQVLEIKEVNLNDVIADLMKMLRRVIGEHITLEIMTGHDLGIIHADPGQIEQILMNLCINARDAMPEGGRITIETENVRFDEDYCASHAWAAPGRYALLSVTDTGCGMDTETLSKVFEPFFTTKDVGQGTGLGLSTVYGLVKQHQGLIHPYSEIGKGSTFKIYFPLVERSASMVGHKIEGPVPKGSETILLAEDEEMVRGLTRLVLERSGYTVLVAQDGQEAVELLKRYGSQIDLALLDVMMPKIGGRGVYEIIQQTHPNIRVLFASGYSANAIHTDFILHENLELIQKPCRGDDLLRKVREVLDR